LLAVLWPPSSPGDKSRASHPQTVDSPLRCSGYRSPHYSCSRIITEAVAVSLLNLFGLFAVAAMLVTYALEARSTWFILAFAVSCALGSIYGFLQGAWPFGLVESIWAVVAVRRWWQASHSASVRSTT
jgi:hypothetical protein